MKQEAIFERIDTPKSEAKTKSGIVTLPRVIVGFLASFLFGYMTAFAAIDAKIDHFQHMAVNGGAAAYDPDNTFYWLRIGNNK